MKQKKIGKKIVCWLFVILFLFTMISPMLYMAFASFMTEGDLNHIPPKLIPSVWTLKNYVAAFAQQPLLKYVFNSFVITIIAMVICITAGCMASYALTRTNIRFKKLFLVFVLAISLLPTITLINPIFKMYSKFGLLNTHIGLALIISVLDLPMTIWFLTAALKGIPVSFEESAKLDGANLFQLFIYVIIPLLKASIFSISILVFIGAWNRFLLSQVLNQYEQYRTVVVGLTLYQTTHTIPFGVVAAAGMITVLPLMILVLLFQKNILGGIMEGGVKE